MTTTIELIEELTHESIHIRDGQCDDEFHSELLTKAAKRLRELDKPDCAWVKLPCGRDSSGNELSSYDPSCIVIYTDEPLPMKLTKFCPSCGGAVIVKEST